MFVPVLEICVDVLVGIVVIDMTVELVLKVDDAEVVKNVMLLLD